MDAHPPSASSSAPVAEPAVTPAAIVGALLMAVLMGVFVWLAVREDAVRADLAAAAQARRDARPVSEGDRIRAALINAQAAAERVWRASTPPEQRRVQEEAMLAHFRAEEEATLTMQRLRRLGSDGAASDVTPH